MSNQKSAIYATKMQAISGLVLDWLPGESLYSLIARNHAVRGHIAPMDTINDFFGMSKDRRLIDGRTELDCLIERTEGSLGSSEEILTGHTVLRAYMPLLRQREKRFLLPPGRLGGISMLKFPFGLHTGRFRSLYPLKGCRACVEEDRAETGMPYWRLEHQFPGVWICPKHNLPLFRTNVEPSRSDRVHLIVPSLEQFATVPDHLASHESFESFRWLSEFVISTTNQFHEGRDPFEVIRQRFYNHAVHSGLVTMRDKLRGYSRTDVAELVDRFEKFIPRFAVTEEFREFHQSTHIAHNLLSRYLNEESWVRPHENLFVSAWVELEGIGK